MFTCILLFACFYIGMSYGQKRARKKQRTSYRSPAPATSNTPQPAVQQRPPAPVPARPANADATEQTQPQTCSAVGSAKPRNNDEESLYNDDAFMGEPHCNGLKCNPEVKCNNGERLFCRDVIQKWNADAGKAWSGQYWVRLPTKWRRVDFAVKTKAGKALAIEFDGYGYHANLDREKFQDQLARQNDLLMNGWGVLRFSYFDMKERADECINAISRAVNSQHSMCTATLKLPLFFADVKNPLDPNSGFARTLPSKRNTRYIPVADVSTPLPFSECQYWAPCPISGCPGRIWRDDSGRYHNWTCDNCGKVYFDNSESLPNKEKISRKTEEVKQTIQNAT